MARSCEPPHGALVVRTYGELDQFVGAFAEGLLNLLVIIGRPGVQKSRAVKAALGGRACWIDGSVSAFGLYGQLYRHRDQPVVIDDVDGLYADRAAVRLLKCALQFPAQNVIPHRKLLRPLPDRAPQTPGLAFRGDRPLPGNPGLV